MVANLNNPSVLKNNNLADDGTAVKDAVHLNDLDSWQEFHEAVLK